MPINMQAMSDTDRMAWRNAIERLRRQKIAIGVAGQSNERGSVLRSDAGAWPQAFGSLRKPADRAPHFPAVSRLGGWWSRVQDDLWDAGYDVTIINGAVGSASMISDFAGHFNGSTFRNAAPLQKRPPSWAGDRGAAGSLTFINGVGYFRCTKGNHTVLFASGQRPYPMADAALDAAYQDYKTLTGAGNARGQTFAMTGSAAPLWMGPAGTVVADGGCEWTCERATGGPMYPIPGPSVSGIFTSAHAGYGFDPYGALQRLHEAMQRVDADRKIIYIANGQSDLGAASDLYSAAVQSVAMFFLDLGYEVMIGLTCFKPDANNGVALYDALKAGRADAIVQLKAGAYAARVWSGADLYTLMGTTGPMGVGGAFLHPDNTHLNGAGCVGPDVGGISCAGKYVGDAIRAALA